MSVVRMSCASLVRIFVFMLLLWSVWFTTSLVLRCSFFFALARDLKRTHRHTHTRMCMCTHSRVHFSRHRLQKALRVAKKNQLTPHSFLVLKSIWCSFFSFFFFTFLFNFFFCQYLCYSDNIIHHIWMFCVTLHLNETRRENQIENWNGHWLRWH